MTDSTTYLLLLGVASIANIAVLAAIVRYRQGGITQPLALVAIALAVTTVAEAFAVASGLNFATTALLGVADLALIAIAIVLIRRARADQLAKAEAERELQWQQSERSRALHDRCANMF